MDLGSSQSSELSEEEGYRAHLYRLLARLLGAPADQDLFRLLQNLDGDDSPMGQAIGALSDVAARITMEEAAQEYHDIFIGVTEGELVPFGSYYMTGFLHEKPLLDLRNSMSELGIARTEEAAETEDHIASLCEIMHGMITGEFGKPISLAAQHRFFEDHVAIWADKFFEDLEAAKSARFYMPVGLIGKLFLEIEGEAFKIAA